MKLSGAEIIIKLLERQGIKTIAGIPGGANLPMYDALGRSDAIRHILTRHEQGAGFIAQGMARVSGKPAVFFATSGPGATNTLTAIADAKLDSIPIICITGQVPLSMIGTDAFQEVDTYGLSVPITKHNFLVRSVEELLEVIPAAFRIASSGRPGPVVIDVPKDVQAAQLEFDVWPDPGQPVPTPELFPGEIEHAAGMINKAEKPILYLGGGVIQSDSAPQALAMAEKGGIPSVVTLMGLGIMPTDHPLSLGMLGMHAARYTNMALEECDLLIAVGVRFDDRATGKVPDFCPKAKVIHMDIDPSELDKIKTAHASVTGDVGEVLKALIPLIKERKRSVWNEDIRQLKEANPMVIPQAEDPMSPYGVILKTAELVGESAVICTDVGQHQMRTAQVYPFKYPRQWLTSGGLGTMGFGMPAAIGAALAAPDKPVVCFSGDGSIMMNIQDLATAMEYDIPIKIILTNNNALGLVRQQQDLFYGKRYTASDYSKSVDFIKIAEGFGIGAYDLGTSNDPARTLAEALAAPGPCLIHVPISPDEPVYPMVPPGAANSEMIGGENHV
ncbi:MULTISPECIES: acetolactate synthase large subunit [unclassified Pseudodesulfovibrio]|uniref:acetolactate synthase large subunit n=1 Tax=unclassified Pseudodesulfovibrio TaxID=2661612 RepID=UPI000FEB91F1|nr:MULTISPECIES: acetolactate synthase large subunit [unclassified Pseudodesulfovibrio]MCJ2163792.1 acetolactate synthase large subunit [Pseudodesulfovibrio sp. S3-i]RWU05960.1 acetolactate synthase large subunit [Pseudodesulfovibrio sp. S3]